MAGRGTTSNKQLYRTVQNKIKLENGIVRRPVESAQGYVSALFNYEMKNDTLTVRPGTRVMNNLENQQFYCIDSFRMCNMDVVVGLNYKRELWAWLEKWPETDFKVYNTSPFVSYPHKSDAGVSCENRHFAFARGNKFFMNEDDYSIIVSNDYGDIYRIMKVGSIRITEDSDANTYQTEDIDNARVLDLGRARLYVDIKNATNKIFTKEVHINDDPIRRSHRITGETRFAHINELGVVSELSDATEIEGYRHVVASSYNILPYTPESKSVPIKRIVNIGSEVADGCKFYSTSSTGTEVVATEGTTWSPSNPYTTKVDVSAIVMVIENLGKQYDSSGNLYEIPSGIYMCAYDKSTGNAIELEDSDWNNYIVQLSLRSPVMVVRDGTGTKQVSAPWSDEQMLLKFDKNVTEIQNAGKSDRDEPFALVRVKFNGGEFQRLISNYKVSVSGGTFDFDGNLEILSGNQWIKMLDYSEITQGSTTSNVAFQITEPESVPTDNPYIFGFGKIFQADFLMAKKATGEYGWHESHVVAFEAAFNSGVNYLQLKNNGYDTWQIIESGLLSISSVNLQRRNLVIGGIDDEADFIVQAERNDFITDFRDRFAIWNNNYIQGISQRCFYNLTTKEIEYYGDEQSDTGNYNKPDVDNLMLINPPIMSLDYTGLRRIPMTYPAIRRAMRNPQAVVVAGSSVYSVEDNKIWLGNVSEFMFTDFVDLNTAIYDIAEFGSGVVASTKDGLYLVEKGSEPRRVVDGEGIIPRFTSKCSGGVLVVEQSNVYIVYRHFTQSGSWYPAVTKISNAISEVNFNGELKSVSIGDIIYLADENMVWLYDVKKKIWCGQYNYGENGEMIQSLFVFKEKLGVVFMTGVDREKSFDAPDQRDN